MQLNILGKATTFNEFNVVNIPVSCPKCGNETNGILKEGDFKANFQGEVGHETIARAYCHKCENETVSQVVVKSVVIELQVMPPKTIL